MTQQGASRLVFLMGALMAVYVLLRAKRDPGADTFRSLWAIGVLTLGLAIAADFVPQVAGPFAVLVFVAMVARNRGELGRVLATPGGFQVREGGTSRNVKRPHTVRGGD